MLPKLWSHESMRVFHDRLINDDDKHTFKLILCDILKKHLDVNWTPESVSGLTIMFGDFLRPSVPGMERPYEEISDLAKLQHALENYLDAYNLDSTSNQLKYVSPPYEIFASHNYSPSHEQSYKVEKIKKINTLFVLFVAEILFVLQWANHIAYLCITTSWPPGIMPIYYLVIILIIRH